MSVTSTMVPVMASTLLVGLMWSPVRVSGKQPPPSLPGRLGDFISQQVNLDSERYQRLMRGEPITKLLPGDASKEMGIFGAVWIEAPIAAYVEAVRNIEHFEKGPNFVVTKRISDPPRLEDFSQLTLPPEDVEDLKTCRVGNCDVKLGEEALRRIQAEVDWSQPLLQTTSQVEMLFKHMAFDYVIRYRKGGNEELGAYRDTNEPTFMAQEFKTMIDRTPLLTAYLPRLKTYLLTYPKASLPGAESLVYWESMKFGMKPTIRINHVVIAEDAEGAAVATKMLYANHYFLTAIELRVLVPDPARGKGFWFANVSQTRSDGLSGYLGPIIRAKVRDEAHKGMEAVLKAAKASLEKT
jgi:hypothetical protein